MGLSERINRSDQAARAEREDSPDRIQSGPAVRLATGSILFGKATTNWTSGTTITLDPCDIAGSDNGKANVNVYLKTDKGTESVTTATIAGGSEGVSCQITQNTIIPHCRGSDGNYYIVGTKKQIMTEFRVDGTNKKLEAKVRFDWGVFCTSESGWELVHTGTACP